MFRRDLIAASASAVAANAVWALTGCGAQATPVEHAPVTGDAALDAFLTQVNECALVCETCVARSTDHAAHGMADMAECARRSRECATLCRAVIVLATGGSPRLAELARLCAAACDDCAAQCQSHASMEAACARCAEVCPRCADACRRTAEIWLQT